MTKGRSVNLLIRQCDARVARGMPHVYWNQVMTAIVRIAVVLALVTLLPTPALAVSIVFDAPSEGATVTGSVVVAVTVSSASGDRSIKISLDGLRFASQFGSANSLRGD